MMKGIKMISISISEFIEFMNCKRKFYFKRLHYSEGKLHERVERKSLMLENLEENNISLNSFKDKRDIVNLFYLKKYIKDNAFKKRSFYQHYGDIAIKDNYWSDQHNNLVFFHTSGHASRDITVYKMIMYILQETTATLVWLKTPNIKQKVHESEEEFKDRYFVNCKINSEQIKLTLNELNNNIIIVKKLAKELYDLSNTDSYADRLSSDPFSYENFNVPNVKSCCHTVETCPFYKECWGEIPKEEVYASPRNEVDEIGKRLKNLQEEFSEWYSKLNQGTIK
jgi:hypothetical protein